MLRLLFVVAFAGITAVHSGVGGTSVPFVRLRNGVKMPAVLFGTGTKTWMNNTSTEAAVLAGLLAGFTGIDTANHYRNQKGVASGIKKARAAGVHTEVFLATKVEDCGNSVDPRSPVLEGHCFNQTLTVFNQNLEQLEVGAVDLTLIHGPPCIPNASWVNGSCMGNPAEDLIYPHQCNCAADEPCQMIQEQWLALEKMYKLGKTKAIGVANFCQPCLECIAKVSTETPMVNQVKFHVGMPGTDPATRTPEQPEESPETV